MSVRRGVASLDELQGDATASSVFRIDPAPVSGVLRPSSARAPPPPPASFTIERSRGWSNTQRSIPSSTAARAAARRPTSAPLALVPSGTYVTPRTRLIS